MKLPEGRRGRLFGRMVYSFSRDVKWIRFGVYGPGVIIKRTPLLFSERNGYTSYLPIPFTKWRLAILGAVTERRGEK